MKRMEAEATGPAVGSAEWLTATVRDLVCTDPAERDGAIEYLGLDAEGEAGLRRTLGWELKRRDIARRMRDWPAPERAGLGEQTDNITASVRGSVSDLAAHDDLAKLEATAKPWRRDQRSAGTASLAVAPEAGASSPSADRPRQPESVEVQTAGVASTPSPVVPPVPADGRFDLDAALARGAPGLPALAEPKPVAKPADDGGALARMNRDHAAIASIGGKFRVARWLPAADNPRRKRITYQTIEDFKAGYSNDYIQVPNGVDKYGNPLYGRQSKGDWWLAHPDRRQFTSVIFAPDAPEEAVRGCLNLWQGWGVEAKPGDWGLIHRHILEVICGGNADFARYVLRWIAWAVQNPGRPAEVALVLIGEKGAGKGTLAQALRKIFYPHEMQIDNIARVTGRFNNHLEDCILLIADEMSWAGNTKARGALQGLITEPTVMVEPKNIGMYQVRNTLHVVMLAEPGWVIPAGGFERRFAAFEVSDARRGDHEYFDALRREIDGDGPAAMFWDLKNLPLDDWHPRELPEVVKESRALTGQQSRSLPPMEAWWHVVLDEGRLPGGMPKRPFIARSKGLRESAKASAGALRDRMTDLDLANFLKSDLVGAVGKRQPDGAAWEFPPLPECRARWSRRFGAVDWPADQAWEWWREVGIE